MEREMRECPTIVATYESPFWEPYSDEFERNEGAFHKETHDNFLARAYGGYQDSILATVLTAASEHSFVYALARMVNIDGDCMHYILSLIHI